MKVIDIDAIADEWANRSGAIAVPYLKELEGSTKQRIHNEGKDSDGQQIGLKNERKGKYSKGYENRKKKIVGEGNLYPINLQLKGDLLRSFTVGNENGIPVLRFQDEENANKAAYNEKNFKTDIYKPTTQQLEDAKEVMVIGIREVMGQIFEQ
jgi:hypothetical protein